MRKAPGIYKVEDLINQEEENTAFIDGEWVPARPLGFYSIKHRMKCAWEVLIGKVDVLVWPKGQ